MIDTSLLKFDLQSKVSLKGKLSMGILTYAEGEDFHKSYK